MRAVVKAGAGRGVEYTADAPEPKAGDGAVVVEVAAASSCGTDRECHEWSPAARAFDLKLPVVLGHEAAGTIVEGGAGVENLRVGDRVALESRLPCGRCFACRTGDAHICQRTQILGLHFDGVFAERVAVPHRICVPLPDSVPSETGALLGSAGVAVHAIQRAGYWVAGRGVLVSGAGPVGMVVARLTSLMGAAYVIVIEPNPFRRAEAERLGVITMEPGNGVAERSRELSGHRRGADVAFEAPERPPPSLLSST